MTEHKSKVYTKTGDKGETGLVGGTRVKKSDERISLYGEVDELNSILGLVLSFLPNDKNKADRKFLIRTQENLFSLGSNLACEQENREKFKLPKINLEDIQLLESEIDKADSKLEPLSNFILPGGSNAASFLHLARTVCRRLERSLVAYDFKNPDDLPEYGVVYINRLSDYLFIISRLFNLEAGVKETLWSGSN